MSLQAIRLDGEPGQELLQRSDLGPDIRVALTSARSTSSPAVFIIANEDAAAFACCGDLIVHKSKSRTKHLAYLALGKPHIPFVHGEYSSDGKALQSFRTLLRRAREQVDNNVYLMAVSAQIFAELWSQAIPLPRTESAQPARSAPDSGPAKPVHALTPAEQTLMKLLPDVVIPDKLAQEFIGDSLEVRLVRKLIVKASENDKPVLILGDSGTGKEVVARLIHNLGARRTATFMAVNCGAIPRDLFESMLFGYLKGAHSTAFLDKEGLWRVADGGTLFLDEIADLSLEHQVKILRVLDQGEILPVGAQEPIPVNARILAATNKDLFAMVRAGQFREELYYRLRAMFIRTPSLRSHPNDIPALVQALWKKATGDDGSELAPEVLAVLKHHAWPGNVRDLQNCLATVFNLFGSKDIGIMHLQAVFGLERSAPDADGVGPVLGDVAGYEAQCLRHLFQVDEVLRAVQTPMRDVNMGKERTPENFLSIAAGTEDRVNEFEVLCAHPILFHGVTTFGKVRRLKEKLRRFAEMMRADPDSAQAYWKRELEPDFADALQAVFDEKDRVKGIKR